MASSNNTYRNHTRPYPAIEDYAFIGDCHSVALVARAGSIDWACMPRISRGSRIGRLFDWKRGGYCSISPTAAGFSTSRQYIDNTLVLETRFDTDSGAVRVIDCLTMKKGGARHPHHR
jgi:GH15 family glucan-1,4-alpha-glucosidase